MGLLQSVADAIKSITTSIMNLPSNIYILFRDGLIFLFVPEENYFSDKSDELYNLMVEKLPFIDDIKKCYDGYMNVITGSGTDAPVFTFTYKGMTMNIFDFSIYEPYRYLVNSIMIFTSYFFFIRKLLKGIPGLIGGFYNS